MERPDVTAGATAAAERQGLLLMVASAASFALMAAIAKRWLPHTPTQAVVLSRGLLLTRGALGYVALSCYF